MRFCQDTRAALESWLSLLSVTLLVKFPILVGCVKKGGLLVATGSVGASEQEERFVGGVAIVYATHLQTGAIFR